MKILSPAGNFESLKTAVYNGADEVYLGINDFNARNNIDGFTLETLLSAVDFAHVYGVKVNLAINILFLDSELKNALKTVVDAYNLGVDSFIVQDLGLMKLIYENYPEIELHSSTQMAIHNLEGAKYLKQFGVKRVVLARETPLNEIKRIKENLDMEIEYFVQGALCVSFSGNCYLSSHMFDASGNRGKCKQLCRLPYSLNFKDKEIKKGYLLSAKDFCLIDRLKDLRDAGVDVLKIEGRARRPSYVAISTREYKRAIENKQFDKDNLRLAFNREYTEGYFNGNGQIISPFQNHIGVYVGKVEKVNNGKNFNEVYFSSNRKLSKKSTFKVFSFGIEKDVLTAYDLTEISFGKYKLTTTKNLKVNDALNLIIDASIEEEVLGFNKKRKLNIFIIAKENQPISAKVMVNDKTYQIDGEVLIKAQSRPLTIEEIKENFSKNEYFDGAIEKAELENVFISKGKLNEFRRKVYQTAYEVITESFRRNLEMKNVILNRKFTSFNDFCVIDNLEQNLDAKNVIYSPEIYNIDDILSLKEKCEKQNKVLYLDTPNFALKEDINFLEDIIEKTKVKIVANNYYALSFNTDKIIGGGLNVYNSVTANHFSLPIITAENGLLNQSSFPEMTLRHCPIKNHVGGDCKNCKYVDGYYYKMESGKILKLKRKKLSTCTFYLV